VWFQISGIVPSSAFVVLATVTIFSTHWQVYTTLLKSLFLHLCSSSNLCIIIIPASSQLCLLKAGIIITICGELLINGDLLKHPLDSYLFELKPTRCDSYPSLVIASRIAQYLALSSGQH
jgi:hypothetical protein